MTPESLVSSTRQWLEESEQLPLEVSRSEWEALEELLAKAKGQRSEALEHQRRLQSLKFKASKKLHRSDSKGSSSEAEALLSSLWQKVEATTSVEALQGLLEAASDGAAFSKEQQEQLTKLQEAAQRRLASLQAGQEAARLKTQESELEALQKKKEEVLSKIQKMRVENVIKEHSAASRETSAGESNLSSRSNSDVGLRPEPPEAERHSPKKGKGKGAPKAPPKAKAKAKGVVNNGLVHINWHVVKDEEKADPQDSFLSRLRSLRLGDGDPETLAPEPAIFSSTSELQVPPALIELFWKKRETVVPRRHSVAVPDGGRQSLLDEKKLQMLGISLKRHEHRNQGVKGAEAIPSIKCAILRCDFEVLHIECVSVIRTVIKQHENDGQPVTSFVAQQGEHSLDGLRCPIEHRLVYELCKVPQIVDRLECMLFHKTFRDNLGNCQRDLEAHHQALEMLSQKRRVIQRFFLTALRFGQSLNRSSKRASQAPYGFELASLEKLAETKSTKLPRMSVLHFVLALLSPEEVEQLFPAEDLALLQEAAIRKTHKVYSDCIDIAQGLYSVQNICQTGMYVRPSGEAVTIHRRRRTLPARSAPEESDVDDNDLFFEVMHEFVSSNLKAAEDLSERAFNLILLYKELAIYFDDLRSVYPPPKNENDTRKDLVEVFHRFATAIRLHRDQVESERLRETLEAGSARKA